MVCIEDSGEDSSVASRGGVVDKGKTQCPLKLVSKEIAVNWDKGKIQKK